MRSRAEVFRLAFESSLLALAVTLGLVESFLIPPLPVPGLRLGLANLAVLLAFAVLGPARALRISLARVILVGLAAGTLGGPTGLLSAAGAIAAWFAMWLLFHLGRDAFSVVGWSLGGSAAHVVGQLIAACFLAGSFAPLLLMPFSLALSLVSGLLIGYSARLLLARVPSRYVSLAL